MTIIGCIETYKKNFIKVIRIVMAQNGYTTHAEIAEWLGVNRVTMQKILTTSKASQKPTLEHGILLCLKAGINANYLFLNKGNMYLKENTTLDKIVNELAEIKCLLPKSIENTTVPKKPKPQIIRKTLNNDERILVDSHLKKENYRFYLFMHMFFHSGARIKEFLKISFTDLDLDNQIFWVTTRKGKNNMPKKEYHVIKDIALPYWKEYIEGCNNKSYLFSKGFVSGQKALGASWVTHLWQKLVKIELGIDVDFYSLKHLNYDETTEAAGMNIAALHANHKSLEMGKVYAVGEMKRKINALKVVSNPFVKPKEKATQ